MNNDDFDNFFKLMQTSFPKNEYRTYENQKKLLSNPYYNIKLFKDENNVVQCFLAFWEFDSFIFIEHLAVNPDFRGMGIGSKTMREFIQNSNLPIVLEIETPQDQTSIRRLKFYEKLGFNINKFEYFQPPLRENTAIIPLAILSYPKKLSETEFKKVKRQLYNAVYEYDLNAND